MPSKARVLLNCPRTDAGILVPSSTHSTSVQLIPPASSLPCPWRVIVRPLSPIVEYVVDSPQLCCIFASSETDSPVLPVVRSTATTTTTPTATAARTTTHGQVTRFLGGWTNGA